MAKIPGLEDVRDWTRGRFLVGDRAIWILYFIFVVISSIAVSSVTGHDGSRGVGGHLVTIFIGFGAMWVISRFPHRWLRSWGPFVYSVAVIISFVWLKFSGSNLNGATRWVQFLGFSIQPSEFFKICLICWGAVAGVKSFDSPKNAKRNFLIYWGMSGACLLYLGASNLSYAVLFGLFVLAYSFLLDAPKKLLFSGIAIGAVVGTLFVTALLTLPNHTLASVNERTLTWKKRIKTMMVDKDEATIKPGDVTQEDFASIAVANGKFLGLGPYQGRMKESLPMRESDFIYATIIEEWGALGMFGIPALYVAWFVIAMRAAWRERNLYRRYLLYGIGILFPMQALVNICVVGGLFLTGQTLPLISKGGSSILVSSIALGIMACITNTQQVINRKINELKAKGIEIPQDLLEH